MGSWQNRLGQKRLSYLLLGLLLTIGLSVLYIHSIFEPAPLPPFLKENTTLSVPSVTQNDLSLPVVEKFKKLGPKESYDNEGLFEKINGKAPLYIDNGFVRLNSQRYALLTDSSRWFEIYLYDMKDSKNAFAVFSSQRRADSKASVTFAGYDHYLTENGLFLRLGNYYIEIIGSDTSSEIQKGMTQIILSFLEKNKIKKSPIEELLLFPEEGLVPTSFRLYQTNAFGSDVLTNTFVARYIIDSQPVTAYISIQKSSEKAKEAGEAYHRFLIESGGTIMEEPQKPIRFVDLFGTVESLFIFENYVAGVHEADDRKPAETLSSQLLKNLQLLKSQ